MRLSQPARLDSVSIDVPDCDWMQVAERMVVVSDGANDIVVVTTVSHPFGLSIVVMKTPTSDELHVVPCALSCMAGTIEMVVVTTLSQPSNDAKVFS